MSPRYGAARPALSIVLGSATVAGIVAGYVGVLGAASAQAQPAASALHYTCTFPTIGGQPIDARLSTGIPASLPAGASSPPFSIDAQATVDSNFTFGLHYLLGVRNLEGSIDTAADVFAPEGPRSVPVHLTIPRTSVPSSGSFHIPATGLAPSLTFRTPGSGRVTAGDFTLHLVPEDADGHVTSPGKVDVPCTLNPGENNVVGLFQITGTAATTGPATPRTPSGAGSTGSASASGTPSATGSGNPGAPGSATPSSAGSGTAIAVPSGNPTPGPARSTLNAAAAAATSSGHGGAWYVLLLAAGVLVVGTAAAVFRRGSRRKTLHRP